MRVLLADGHAILRAGLNPDIVIRDLAMPGMHGIQATRRITALGLGARILVLTMHDEDEFLVPALNAGAAGFLNKSVADTDLIGAVEALAHGHSYLPRQAAALLARRQARDDSNRRPGPGALSPRELAVIELYASGFSTREMGEKLFLSPKTVDSYLTRAKTKLGLHRRSDIVRFALDAGLLRAGGEG
ncbi:MAG: response regulator transcription factor [Bryobacterales bacterium]|nr:response regulator transcription factor [Bryobacterales bacterium]